MHADLKPSNAVRLGEDWRLIDLDGAAQLGAPVGQNSSGAFAPPELLYADADGRWRARAVDEEGLALVRERTEKREGRSATQ